MLENMKQGSIKGRIMPFILQDIYNQNLTGMLSLRSKSVRKFIFSIRGKLVYVQSSLPDEQLGKLMLSGGAITDLEYGKIKDLVRSGGWANPEIVQSGLTDEKTIKWWLNTLIREVVFSVFLWDEGDFRFFYDKKPPKTVPTSELNTLEVIFACIRRIRNPRILVEWLGDLDAIPEADYDFLTRSSISLTPKEGYYISRVDGSLSFRQILSIASEQRLEMLKFFVAALITGMLKTKSTPGRDASSHVRVRIKGKPAAPVEDKREVSRKTAAATRADEKPDEEPEPTSTEDIKLTEEELKEIESLQADPSLLSEEVKFSSNRKVKEAEKVDVTAKVSYLRDGEFIDTGDEEAIDIDELKTIRAEEKRLADIPEDKLTLFIGGKEVDANESLIGDTGVGDIFSSGDAEEQWGKWISVSAEESDEEVLAEWQKNWRRWEDQHKEMKTLQEKRRQLEENMKTCSSIDSLELLQKRYEEIDRHFSRLINQKKREILTAHRRSQVQNHYEVLRVPRDASLDDIKSAYFTWVNEFQPDKRYLSEFATLSDILGKVVERLHQAYETLSDEKLRKEYDEMLEEQARIAEKIAEKKKLLAQDHFRSAREAIAHEDYMLALRFLRSAMSLDPRNPLYFQEMARILSGNRKWLDESLRFYHRAFQLQPDNPDLLVDVARVSIMMDKPDFARKALQHALSLNPNHKMAKKYLAALSEKK